MALPPRLDRLHYGLGRTGGLKVPTDSELLRRPPPFRFSCFPFAFRIRSAVVREWYGARLAPVNRPVYNFFKIAKIVIFANKSVVCCVGPARLGARALC